MTIDLHLACFNIYGVLHFVGSCNNYSAYKDQIGESISPSDLEKQYVFLLLVESTHIHLKKPKSYGSGYNL